MSGPGAIIPVGQIDHCILLIRGQRVILDSDLARLYGVTTSRLNEQVKRNIERFRVTLPSNSHRMSIKSVCNRNLRPQRKVAGAPIRIAPLE